jgi:ribosome-binding protein aMBF1 (putative translation factor)
LAAFSQTYKIPYFGEHVGCCLYLREVNPKDKTYQRAYKAFRERLIKARTDAGMTQVEVNKRMGKPHSFMSKCELGERRVDFVELQTLANIYGKGLSFFVTEE